MVYATNRLRQLLAAWTDQSRTMELRITLLLITSSNYTDLSPFDK
jgi:hypothetical protein